MQTCTLATRAARGLFYAIFAAFCGMSAAEAAYPLAEIKNNTEYTVSGTVEYASAFCSNDRYSVGPGGTWRASSRGVCLITGITGSLSGVPASLRGTGRSSYGERQIVTPYSSSGTAYAKFQINAYGDRYRIFSESEWAKEGNTGQGKSPGFRFVNYTAWPISVSFDQVGCLYYGVVPAQFDGRPGEFRRDTGAVWFTIRAHIQPDAINPQSDWDCAEPVVELVGDVALAAMTGGGSAAASAARVGGKIAAKQIAKAAIKSAAKKAVKEVAKFGAKELGEYLTLTSSIEMFGQYAGYAWPFQCDKMPEYHISGGPVPVYDEFGEFYIEAGPPLKIEKANTCGNDMMLGSVKSATAEEVDPAVYFGSSDAPSNNDGGSNNSGGDGDIVSAPQGAQCAGENQRCSFSGTRKVYYGANGRYAVRTFTNGVDCTNAVFGDPVPGVYKYCFVENAGGTPSNALTGDGVNGRNVVRADFVGGRFEQASSGQWVEYDASGVARFSFAEQGRDDWSVYLHDGSRNVQIQIDIWRRMITYGANGGPKSDLYPITASWRR